MTRAGRCLGCGGELPPGRRFCRLSCRLALERRQLRLPGTLPALELTTELPTAEEVGAARSAGRRRPGLRRSAWRRP
jgi:hypothetical protein